MGQYARNFSNLIDAFVVSMEKTAIPLILVKWAAISAIAGAMGRRTWYDFGPFKVSPNLFICLVAEPARGKSVSLQYPFNECFRAISERPGSPPSSWRNEYEDWGAVRPTFLIQDRITPEQFVIDMCGVERMIPEMSSLDKPFYESSVSLVTSEFGIFMNRENTQLQMFLTDMWDGKPEYSYRTKNAGTFLIKGPCLNWIVCSTPEQLVSNLPANARSQGLLSRMVLVYWDGPEITQDLFYNSPNQNWLDNFKQDLADISNLYGQFQFADKETFEEARDWVRAGMKPKIEDVNMREYNERRLSHLLKISMVVSAATSNTRLISKENWEYAKELIFEVEEAMPRALAKFGLSDTGRNALELGEAVFLAPGKTMKLTEFTRLVLSKVKSAAEAQSMISNMEKAGLVKITNGIVRGCEVGST